METDGQIQIDEQTGFYFFVHLSAIDTQNVKETTWVRAIAEKLLQCSWKYILAMDVSTGLCKQNVINFLDHVVEARATTISY